jgi:antitoxin component YwqK of YwqJK toxin-antitoxin module
MAGRWYYYNVGKKIPYKIINYKNNKLDSIAQYFDDSSGFLIGERIYENGKSNHVEFMYYPNTIIKNITIRVGDTCYISRGYYENGVIKSEKILCDKAFLKEHVISIYIGEWKYYNEYGKLIRKEYYENNVLIRKEEY